MHAQLAALDALGDFHFAFAGEQRNGAHLAQVHAHGVVGLFKRAGREVKLDVFALFELESLSAPNLGASSRSMPWVPIVVIRSSRSSAVPISSGMHVVDIAVGEVALFLARIDQVLDVVFKFVVDGQKIPTPPARTSFYAPDRAPVRGPIRAQKKISVWKSAHRANTSLRSPAKKKRSQ